MNSFVEEKSKLKSPQACEFHEILNEKLSARRNSLVTNLPIFTVHRFSISISICSVFGEQI